MDRHCVVRVASPRDAAVVAAIYAPYVRNTTISFEDAPPSDDEVARRIATVLVWTPWLVAEHDGAVIGYAYASRHRERAAYRWAVDVSAYVAEGARGLGVGRALYRRLLELLVAQGFRRAYAGVTLPNDASVGFHRSAGFTPVGVYHRVGYKYGAWHDVAWFERDLGPDDGEPPEPVSFPRLRAKLGDG